MKNALIIFLKNAVSGKVKTRLAATIGNNAAWLVYLKLIAHTQIVTLQVDSDKFLFYSNEKETNDGWPPENYTKQIQNGNDLGERMKNAFEFVFQSGYDQCVIIGTDCFELTAAHINDAFEALKINDFVIGPANDGGYYMLGMKKKNLFNHLFAGKAWGTSSVYEDTLKDLQDNSTFVLPELVDIDTGEDLLKNISFIL
jgi:rSAM/selenodomain-associated transferase 1